ncbi:MAG: flavodoxin family protein [Deltaproteobacteria bacterium]|nr:flavodoxin family protein [Deltaproteobacteria bacterium]
MKIIALVGSPHGLAGSTARLTRQVLASAEAEGAATETIVLKGDTVLPCLGCDVCHKKGECVREDGFAEIQAKIAAADGLVLGSPNYILNVSAQLKAFLDRCGSTIHCLGFAGKYGAAVVTSGGGDEEPIAEYLNQFLMMTGITPVGAVWATMGLIQGDEFPADIAGRADALGQRLVRAWRDQEQFPEVAARMAEFKERMRQLMLWRQDEWPWEYAYWEQKGDL